MLCRVDLVRNFAKCGRVSTSQKLVELNPAKIRPRWHCPKFSQIDLTEIWKSLVELAPFEIWSCQPRPKI